MRCGDKGLLRQLCIDPPDCLVAVCDHVGEKPLLFFVPIAVRPFSRIGRRHPRIVSEYHRIVDQEWPLTIPLDEITDEIDKNIRPVSVLQPGKIFSVFFDQRIGIPLADLFIACDLPETRFVKPRLMWS